jgi:CRISPR-associated protein (TIGR03984 family)
MTKHEINAKHPARLEPLTVDAADDGTLLQWLLDQADKLPAYLLAHADDGVLWGRIDADKAEQAGGADAAQRTGKRLLWNSEVGDESDSADAPRLSLDTLHTLRLFHESYELLLWRSASGWRARRIVDVCPSADGGPAPTWTESLDEPQMLWGTEGQSADHGFTKLTHGAEGLVHFVPIACQPAKQRPVWLVVRHYVNDAPLARIVASRLVELRI